MFLRKLSNTVNRGRSGLKDLKLLNQKISALSESEQQLYFNQLIEFFSQIKPTLKID
jgi:hypothetical protein